MTFCAFWYPGIDVAYIGRSQGLIMQEYFRDFRISETHEISLMLYDLGLYRMLATCIRLSWLKQTMHESLQHGF